MNKLSSGKNSTVLLLVALVLALLFAVYYYVVMPKKEGVSAKESSITTLQATATSLHEQIALAKNTKAPSTVDVFTLRKKVPNSRAVDQLLLNIEQMEFVAGTRINSIGFNNYDSLVSSSGLTDPNYVPPAEGETTESSEITDPNVQTEASTDPNAQTNANENAESNLEVLPVSTIAPEQLPTELKMLTLAIAVEAPTYDSLLLFIRELEQLERVVRVDMIDYSLAGEEAVFGEDSTSIVSANIQVTTFYYEGEQ